MEYRIHPKTQERISVIGIGTGPIFEATYEKINPKSHSFF